MSETATASETAPQPLTRRDLEGMIARKSLTDPTFREEFLADPAACFTKYLNVPAASLPKFVVHEEAPGSWHIVLPPKPDPMRELTDEELEQVSGGALAEAVIAGIVLSVVIGATMAGSAVASSVAATVGSGTAAVGTVLNHKW